MKYYCKHCGGSLDTSRKEVLDYCPFCGSHGTLEKRTKGRNTALENWEKILQLIPELERTRSEYLKYHTEYTKLIMSLTISRNRGNISEEEIPRYIPELTYLAKKYKHKK